MSNNEEDDKPTVVLDLNALRKKKLKEEEDLANLADEIEFKVHQEKPVEKVKSKVKAFKVIYFDFQTTLFSESSLPSDFENIIVKDLKELNRYLKSRDFQILVFHYDPLPKAVNQLCTQIRQKLPTTKLLIVANRISPQKAQIHARTPAGAHGYLSLPITPDSLRTEFLRIFDQNKKATS